MKVLIFFSKGSKCPKLYLFRDRGGGQGVAGEGKGEGIIHRKCENETPTLTSHLPLESRV